jgi:hypothetical protein
VKQFCRSLCLVTPAKAGVGAAARTFQLSVRYYRCCETQRNGSRPSALSENWNLRWRKLGCVAPAEAQGCSGKNRRFILPPNLPLAASFLSLSPRRPGGEGRVRGADEAVCGAAHLTLPGAIAPGRLPLAPKGRRGATSGRVIQHVYNRFRFPGQPCAEVGTQGFHTLAPCSCQGQAPGPRFRGGDDFRACATGSQPLSPGRQVIVRSHNTRRGCFMPDFPGAGTERRR